MIRIYERTAIELFTLSTVAADSTGGGPLEFTVPDNQNFHSGILRGIKISCDSTDFDVSLRTQSNALVDTVKELYRVIDVNKYVSDEGLKVGWINTDTPAAKKLYLVLTNNDLQNPTGVVSVEIMTDINKRFSGNR